MFYNKLINLESAPICTEKVGKCEITFTLTNFVHNLDNVSIIYITSFQTS
jgi:hypothetical protein